MKDIKWTEVLVAEGEENEFWVRVYHSEENAPSFEEVRQEWLDEALTLPHLDITKPKTLSGYPSYCLTMENYSETFLTLEHAHAEMIDWLRTHSDEFSVNGDLLTIEIQERIRHEVDVITDSDWFAELVKEKVSQVIKEALA